MTYEEIVIEGAQLIFSNFEGREDQYNPKGNRNFCVLLDDRHAEERLAAGWNVKYLKPTEDAPNGTPILNVGVRFDVYPPKVTMISSGGRTLLDEGSIGMLDWVEFENVDLIIRPYNYEMPSRDGVISGVKAYLKNMYVTIKEDVLDLKYGSDQPL